MILLIPRPCCFPFLDNASMYEECLKRKAVLRSRSVDQYIVFLDHVSSHFQAMILFIPRPCFFPFLDNASMQEECLKREAVLRSRTVDQSIVFLDHVSSHFQTMILFIPRPCFFSFLDNASMYEECLKRKAVLRSRTVDQFIVFVDHVSSHF